MTIPVGFAQINWRFGGGGLPHGAEVTLGVNPDSGLSPQDVVDLAAQAVVDHVLPAMSATVQLESTLVKFGPDATGPSAVGGVTGAGAQPVTGSVSNVAILVRKVTLSGGRANRGRFYWPGGVDTQIDSAGFLDTTAVSNWETAMADLLTQLQTDLLFPVILHGGAAAPTTIVDFVLQSQAATQRRRLRG